MFIIIPNYLLTIVIYHYYIAINIICYIYIFNLNISWHKKLEMLKEKSYFYLRDMN